MENNELELDKLNKAQQTVAIDFLNNLYLCDTIKSVALVYNKLKNKYHINDNMITYNTDSLITNILNIEKEKIVKEMNKWK